MSYLAEAVGDYDGLKGDGGGREVRVCTYWDYSSCGSMSILRYPSKSIRNKLMRAAINICNNDDIGYEMNANRSTSFYAFREINWDLSKINQVGTCSIDCSEMMGCCVNFALGEKISVDNWTGNEASNFLGVGFEQLDWNVRDLEPGDIILAHNSSTGTGHTGMFIGNSASGEFYDDEEDEEDMKPAWFRITSNGTQYLYADGRFQAIDNPEDLNVLEHIYGELTGSTYIPNIDADDHWVEVAGRYFPTKQSGSVNINEGDIDISSALKHVLNNIEVNITV